MKDELLEEFLAQLSFKASNTKQLFAIGLIGVTGSGKSTVARLLAQKTQVLIESNDSIRRFLNAKGIDGASPDQETLQYIAENTASYLYQNRVSHIIDADMLKFHEPARRKAESFGARFYLVDVSCPENVIKARIEQRVQDLAAGKTDNLSRVGLEEYEKRKQMHSETPQPLCDFTIRSDQPLEPQIDKIVQSLHHNGVL